MSDKCGEFIRLSFIEWNLVIGNDDVIGDATWFAWFAWGGVAQLATLIIVRDSK